MSAKTQKIRQTFMNLEPPDLSFHSLIPIKLSQGGENSKIVEERSAALKAIIEDALKKATNETELLTKILPSIVDSLFLRSGIYSLYKSLIKLCQSDDKNYFWKDIKFSEFVIFFLRAIDKREVFGLLLFQLKIPLPISFNLGETRVKMIQLLKGVMSTQRPSLILNLGSAKARKSGKTTFLFELLSLPKNYMYEEDLFYEDSVYAHKLSADWGNNLLVDFNGCFEKMPSEVSALNDSCGLLILHITESDLYNSQGEFIGDQFFKQNRKVWKSAQKILLVVRNSQKITSQVIIDSLSKLQQKIDSKCFVYCLGTQQKETDFTQIAKLIAEKKLLKLTKIFDDLFLLNDNMDREQVSQLYITASDVINMLPSQIGSEENLTQQLFPHTFANQQLNQLKAVLIEKQFDLTVYSRQESEEKVHQIRQIQQKIKGLEEKLRRNKTSEFNQNASKILARGIRQPLLIQIFASLLYFWKKPIINNLMLKYDSTKKQLKKLDQTDIDRRVMYLKEMEKIKSRIDMHDISLSTIFHDTTTKLQFSKITQQTKQQQQARAISEVAIYDFYGNAYKSINPINLVDGNDLIFGNKYLKEFCSRLSDSQKFKNKKVYIVSVIGAQSSGKSTLLNYLFRCQFETSAGRCTKGMYFNICEYEDKIVWVIDTEGLLSLTARDQVFDNKIATFVLSISDVVIINNQGELTDSLQEMLKICNFAMNQLQNETKIRPFKPLNLIFTIQSNQPSSQNKQDLNKANESLIMQQLPIKSENIFHFPRIFRKEKSKFQENEAVHVLNEAYSDSVLNLRSRIMTILDKEQQTSSSFYESYSRAELCWKTILANGTLLMGKKSHLEIVSKQKINSIYLQNLDRFEDILNKQFLNLFKQQIEGIQMKTLNQKQPELKKKITKKKELLCESFKKDLLASCRQICNRQQWYKDSYDNIQALCNLWENHNIEKLQKYCVNLRQEVTKNLFKEKINTLIKTKYSNVTPKDQIIADLTKEKQKVLEQYKFERKYFKDVISPPHIIYIGQALERGFYEERVCKNSAYWLASYRDLLQSKKYEQMYNIWYKSKEISQLNKERMEKQFLIIFNKIKEMCEQSVGIKNLQSIKDLRSLSNELHRSMKNIYLFAQKDLQSQSAQDLSLIDFESLKMKSVLRGCLITKIAQTYSDQQLSQITKKEQECQAFLKDQIRAIESIFNEEYNILRETGEKWMYYIKIYCKKMLNDKSEAQVKKDLNSLAARSKEFTEKAFKLSFLNPNRSKSKWISCFKMICDANKFIFETACSEEFIVKRRQYISTVTQNEIKNIVSLIKTSELIPTAIKEAEVQLRKYSNLIDMKEIILFTAGSIENLTNISSFIKAKFEDTKYAEAFMEEIKVSAKPTELLNMMDKFINNQFKNKVLGCRQICPFCGVKCCLPNGHSESHEIFQYCHVLTCFYGYCQKNGSPRTKICAHKNIKEDFKYDEEIKYGEVLKKVPKWLNHFQNLLRFNKSPTSQQQLEYQAIWANVKQLVINYRYAIWMKDDNSFNNLIKDPLTEKDLDMVQLDYNGAKVTLRRYTEKKMI